MGKYTATPQYLIKEQCRKHIHTCLRTAYLLCEVMNEHCHYELI